MESTSGAPEAKVREQVSLPAILLMVAAVLGVLGALAGLVLYSEAMLRFLVEHPEAPPDLRDQLANMPPEQLRPLRLFFGLQFILSSFVFLGALMMKGFRSFGLAVAGAVVACIPCVGPCCGLTGIPFGIWSLVVLFSNPEVKKAFRESAPPAAR